MPEDARADKIDWLLSESIAECCMMGTPIGGEDRVEPPLREVLELDPNNLEALNLLAQIRAQREDHDEAIELFTRACEHAPEAEDVRKLTVALAELCEDREKYDFAITVYKIGLEHVEDALFHNGISYCQAKLGEYKPAIQHAERAVALDPGNAKLVSDLGYTLIEDGRAAEAEVHLRRAVELDPSDELAKGNLEYCLSLID